MQFDELCICSWNLENSFGLYVALGDEIESTAFVIAGQTHCTQRLIEVIITSCLPFAFADRALYLDRELSWSVAVRVGSTALKPSLANCKMLEMDAFDAFSIA